MNGTVAAGLLCVEVREAAGMLGVDERDVHVLVAKGKLEACKDGNGGAIRLLISVGSVQRLRSERQRSG